MANGLLASSFIDEARLLEHLNRASGAEDNAPERLTRSLNRAIGWMEARSQRRLKARNYRTQVTAVTVGSTAADAASITVGSTAALVVGDPVLGAGLDVGTVVESITSATAFVPSKRVLAAIASGSTLTFGSAPLYVDEEGNTDATLWVPEVPMLRANLFALYWVGPDGVRSAVSLTYARVDERAGSVRLMAGLGNFGDGRYEFECRAGYEQPTATALGHPEDWEALAAIQLRVAEIYWSDDTQMRGRADGYSVGNMSVTNSPGMPADIENALRPYWRRVP